jgi:hypothetical protein
MAEDLTRPHTADEVPLPAGAPLQPAPEPAATLERRDEPEHIVRPPRSDWEPGPHATRFLFAYGLLGLVLGASVIAIAALTTRDDMSSSVAWSRWKPSADGSEQVRQIASHVALNYRLPSGNELVNVIVRSPRDSDPPLTTVAIDKQTLFKKEQPFKTYEMNDGLMYILCGTGTNCAVGEGTPSIDRHRLLRREALELALYTFRYVDGVDSVLTFLPPAAAQAQSGSSSSQQSQTTEDALYFRKNDPLVKPLVNEPLAATIAGRPEGQVLPSGEANLVDRLTLPALYRYTFQRTGDGQSTVALLQPYPTSG